MGAFKDNDIDKTFKILTLSKKNKSDSMDMSLNKLREMVKDREARHAAVHGVTKIRHDLATEQQQQRKMQKSFNKMAVKSAK